MIRYERNTFISFPHHLHYFVCEIILMKRKNKFREHQNDSHDVISLPIISSQVDPCDDFYEFACGNYGLNRNLAANKPLRHTISDVQARLNKQVSTFFL